MEKGLAPKRRLLRLAAKAKNFESLGAYCAPHFPPHSGRTRPDHPKPGQTTSNRVRPTQTHPNRTFWGTSHTGLTSPTGHGGHMSHTSHICHSRRVGRTSHTRITRIGRLTGHTLHLSTGGTARLSRISGALRDQNPALRAACPPPTGGRSTAPEVKPWERQQVRGRMKLYPNPTRSQLGNGGSRGEPDGPIPRLSK